MYRKYLFIIRSFQKYVHLMTQSNGTCLGLTTYFVLQLFTATDQSQEVAPMGLASGLTK
jgi:hypothetical protein